MSFEERDGSFGYAAKLYTFQSNTPLTLIVDKRAFLFWLQMGGREIKEDVSPFSEEMKKLPAAQAQHKENKDLEGEKQKHKAKEGPKYSQLCQNL